ncbi:MAG: hypothetical protein ABI549_10335 [Flavobacterium sp.]|uniref:hypothetical protein n=1 Tax=Flavobacterium sp. TaxID=239 RepID=UPI003262F815
MKANEDKNIEKLVNHIMKDTALESPSFDFTSNVMSQVFATKTSGVTVYKPLISKTTFIAVFGFIIALFIYLFINGEQQTSAWSTYLNLNGLYENKLTTIFKFSKTTTYAVVLTTVMLLIQISFLKNYFDKQLEK